MQSLTKVCTKCRQTKQLSEFSPSSSWCKLCRNQVSAIRKEKKQELGVKYLNPERHKTRISDKYLQPEQWEKLWPYFEEERVRLYFDLVQNIGLRANEGIEIVPEDVDWGDNSILIHSLKKQETSHERSLPTRPDIVAKLRTLEAPYFPFSYHYAYRVFKRALARADLSSRLGIHTLRHMCATRLREVGASEFDVGYLLRHKGKDVTASYGQAAARRIKAFAEKTWETQTWIWKTKK